MRSNPLDLDLPKRLAAPDGQASRERLRDSLEQVQSSLRAAVRGGLSREQFATEYSLLDAVTAAREVLDAFSCPGTTTACSS